MCSKMSEFPVIPEILEYIFQYLDGISLCYCEQVCHRWRNAIGEMVNVWPQLCEKEIPEDVFYELVNDIDPSWRPGSPDGTLYYDVYHTWFLWRTKLKREEGIVRSTKDVKLNRNIIVCMAVSGDVIITGHLRGLVYFWDSPTFPEFPGKIGTSPIASFKVPGDFTEFELMYMPAWEADHRLNHNLIIATCSEKQKLWVMKIKGLRVSLIQNFAARRVSVHGNSLALLSRGCLQLFCIEGSGDILTESDSIDEEFPIDYVNMWKDQVYALSLRRCRVFHFVAEHRILTCHGTTINPSYLKPIKCYFWRGHIVAKILWSKELVISLSSIDTHKVYDIPSQLYTSPTCLHFRGSVFLIGTDSGAVYIYTIHKEEDLLSLDLCNFVKRWDVSSEGVENLGTCLTSEGLCLVASTARHLYTLTYPCEEL